MMNHTITIEGKRYYTAQVVNNDTGEIYDQTAIFVEDESDYGAPPKFVTYYYGDPDVCNTAYYVAEHQRKENERKSHLEVFCLRLIDLIEQDYCPDSVEDILSIELVADGVSGATANNFAKRFANLLRAAR